MGGSLGRRARTTLERRALSRARAGDPGGTSRMTPPGAQHRSVGTLRSADAVEGPSWLVCDGSRNVAIASRSRRAGSVRPKRLYEACDSSISDPETVERSDVLAS